MEAIKVISAGAGSGKTYRLTQEMVRLMTDGAVRPSGIIATTFTRKAAAELQERVRVQLLQQELPDLANELSNALIGTVHSLGVKLLQRFAFEAGVSPQVSIMAEEDQQQLFNQSLATVLTDERITVLEELSERLGLQKEPYHTTDWRSLLKTLTEAARSNGIGPEDLARSGDLSVATFLELLDPVDGRTASEWTEELKDRLDIARKSLKENAADRTKKTGEVLHQLDRLWAIMERQEALPWYEWARLGKLEPAMSSRELLEPLKEFANTHLAHGQFHADIRSFQRQLFDIAGLAITEYDRYKHSRGIIDYTDMEVMVNRLLDQPSVREVMAEETDLLMVDEFQDTSPLQLSIFLKLSRLARHAVWVGDPKQSIYGFRGADPALMEAVIQRQGGLLPENILSDSWRSREDIVWFTNAVFTRAFPNMSREQVVLRPKRRKQAVSGYATVPADPPGMGEALQHWHFEVEGGGKKPRKEWFMRALAEALHERLAEGWQVVPKGRPGHPRPAIAGDVAILCRTNNECQEMAEALHRAGLRAAISRTGLTGTAEARLVIACLRFLLNRYDPLSTAEIMVLAEGMALESVVEDRLDFLDRQQAAGELPEYRWGERRPFIKRLKELRMTVAALSTAETLAILLEEMELRRVMAAWGNAAQRMANVDVLCQLAQRYEDACHRLQRAASLAGFLIWLQDLERSGTDLQGSGDHQQAVNVLTYHKSKGLEYPVTICFGLEARLSDEVWGVSVMPADTEVPDMDDVLAGRWLRCWVNPYANLFANSVLAARLANSEARQRKREEALAEEARLLYVGITRARDYLVLPVRGEAPEWLERVYGGSGKPTPLFPSDAGGTPDGLPEGTPHAGWPEWNGKKIPVAMHTYVFDRDMADREPAEETMYFLGQRAGKRIHPPFALGQESAGWPGREPDGSYVYAPPLEPGAAEALAVAIRSVLLVADAGTSAATGSLREELLERMLPDDQDLATVVADRLDKFRAIAELPYRSVIRRFPLYPVSLRQGLRRYDGVVDELLDTGRSLHLVSHLVGFSSENRQRQQPWRQALYWLSMAAEQLKGEDGRNSATLWIHHIPEGRVFRFVWPDGVG